MHHSTSDRSQKPSHDKAKSNRKVGKSSLKFAVETSLSSAEEAAEKTIHSLIRLGSQTFAISPFSQYYDDWLVNLRQVISDFESNRALSVDEAFVAERTRVLAEVQGELAKRRIKEDEMEASAKALSENNHLLVDMDAAYAVQARELSAKRNSEVEQLTKIVHELEDEAAEVNQLKTRFFCFTKKEKAKKTAGVAQKLAAAKKELEMAMQNFAVEQDKIHDEYVKMKQATIEKVQKLEREIVNIETDGSVQARQAAAAALTDSVKAFLHRKKVPAQ